MTATNDQGEEAPPGVPPTIAAEAQAAAPPVQDHDGRARRPSAQTRDHHPPHHSENDQSTAFPNIEDVPPPPYNGAGYGQLDISQNGLDTGAHVAEDGRINININQRSRKLTNLLVPALRHQLDLQEKHAAEEPKMH